MKISRAIITLIGVFLFSAQLDAAKSPASGPVTPYKTTTTRGAFTIETVGDTLGQAAPQNTRIIIRISGANKRLVKPGEIVLVDKTGTAIKPVFRQDRKVGHEENTGLPLSMDSGSVGINLNKIFGSHGDYAYTKADWPKNV